MVAANRKKRMVQLVAAAIMNGRWFMRELSPFFRKSETECEARSLRLLLLDHMSWRGALRDCSSVSRKYSSRLSRIAADAKCEYK
jgi:hypothetical protein